MSVRAGAAQALAIFCTDQVQRSRRSGDFVDGIYVPGDAVVSTLMVSVQPASGRDMLRLPEGQRGSEIIKIFAQAADELRVSAPGVMADLIVWRGATYEVQQLIPSAGDWYETLAGRLGD